MGSENRILTRGAALRGALAGVCFFVLLDTGLFRSGLYSSNLEPDSTTGRQENLIWLEKQRQPKSGPRILVAGDSRMSLQMRLANGLIARAGLTAGNLAVPGTNPRCWYYALRDVDPTAQRYRAIVLPVDDYDDEDTAEDLADKMSDLRYLAVRLRWGDFLDFPLSFRSPMSRWQALRATLFPGVVYADDLQAFLSNPVERIEKVRQVRTDFPQWADNYLGPTGSLQGLAVDWAAGKITFPAGLEVWEQGAIRDKLLLPPVPQIGRTAEYRRKWFGRILERYRGTGTRILFLRLPRGPIVRPDNVAKKSSTIREFASPPYVLLCNERRFEELERPELFNDPLHLNATGCERFTTLLVEEVIRQLREHRLVRPRGDT